MLCYGMLCYVMLCYVMLCYVMLCYVMLTLNDISTQGLSTSISELVKRLQQAAVVHLIEGLRHIHTDHVHLFSVV